MPELERDDELALAYGVRLRSVGVRANVGEVRVAAAEVRAFLPDDDARALLTPALTDAGMQPVLAVPLEDLAVPAAALSAVAGEEPYVEMSVPAPSPDEGQVVLEVDDAGLVRWHVDVDAVTTAAAITDGTPPVARSIAPALEQTFRVPVLQADDRRGLLGFGVRKVLHLFRFPIESAAAAAGRTAVGWWEDRHRPHSLTLLTPETFAAVPEPGGVSTARLAELADKPFLVLVHGTFSTIRGGFHGLGTPGLAELVAKYEGRVLGFDHPTLHVDPAANADWFLRRLPADRPVTLDLVTHSRGGLVGRRIAGAAPAGVPRPAVRKLIHVGTPNGGTVLASPKRWTTLIDVFTNLFALLPGEASSTAVTAVVELVKQVATGVFNGLAGLTAMDPGNPAVAAANQRPLGGAAGVAGVVHAVASDFTPGEAGLRLRALNAIVDQFFGAGNDLVVPTQGVYSSGEYRVGDPFLAPSTVVHTEFFADPAVRAKITEWLPGSVA